MKNKKLGNTQVNMNLCRQQRPTVTPCRVKSMDRMEIHGSAGLGLARRQAGLKRSLIFALLVKASFNIRL